MKPFELYIAYIPWGGGGKCRPVLLLSHTGERAWIYPITTQYENKSEKIKANYFPVSDWAQAGLHRQSYIDTKTRISINATDIDEPIGQLSHADKMRLMEFLAN